MIKELENIPLHIMTETIYEVIADKTLSFRCRVYLEGQGNREYICLNHYSKTHENLQPTYFGYYGTSKGDKVSKIIGHPVMIGDVLKWLKEKTYGDPVICNPNTLKVYGKPEMSDGYKHHHEQAYVPVNNVTIIAMGLFDALADEIIHNWNKLEQPIEDQFPQCIQYLYSLILELNSNPPITKE